jgi:ribokinase
MAKPILVIGSVNLDLVASVPRIPVAGETVSGTSFEQFFGGKGANQAVSVARLDYPVKMIAKVGDDDIGKRLREGLSAAGVDVTGVGTASGTSSGVALIATDSDGQNSIVIVPGANGTLLPLDIARFEDILDSAGIILLQLEVPLQTVLYAVEMAYRKHIPVMLDPAPAQELPPKLLLQVTWLTPNETETCTLCGIDAGALSPSTVPQKAEELLARGPKYVVVKLGSQGAYLAGRDGTREWIPPFKVRAIDSTAAGDAFNAALAVALMQNKEPVEAARFASAVAALSVTKKGAQPSMPTQEEVARFLKRAKAAGEPPLVTVRET